MLACHAQGTPRMVIDDGIGYCLLFLKLCIQSIVLFSPQVSDCAEVDVFSSSVTDAPLPALEVIELSGCKLDEVSPALGDMAALRSVEVRLLFCLLVCLFSLFVCCVVC
jgi:hypothetical protein